MLRKCLPDPQRAGDRVVPPNEVPEESLDANPNGITGGFRRVANRPAVLPQVCRDRLQLLSRRHFRSLGLRRFADHLSECPCPRLLTPARLQVIGGERPLVDRFQAGQRLAVPRRWVTNLDVAASRGPGRRILSGQIQLFDPLSWMAQHFGDVADALFMFQNGLTLVEPKTPQRPLPVKGVARLAWPKALGKSRPGENALNRLQLLRRRLAKLPQQPGPAGM